MGIASKTKIGLTVSAICCTLLLYTCWPYSVERMKGIAERDRDISLRQSPPDLWKNLQGPIIDSTTRPDQLTFVWYRILEWGDTAKIQIQYVRHGFGCSFPSEPGIFMNGKWGYLYPPYSSPEDLLPRQLETDSCGSPCFELSRLQDSITISGKFLVPPARLARFLNEGYFEAIQWSAYHTVVRFYQEIAHIQGQSATDTFNTSYAEVHLNAVHQVVIIPIAASSEVQNLGALHRKSKLSVADTLD